jgi:hypothetical protein
MKMCIAFWSVVVEVTGWTCKKVSIYVTVAEDTMERRDDGERVCVSVKLVK